MLRFAAISLSTLLVLGSVFYFLVWHAQPPAAASNSLSPIIPQPVVPTTNKVGPGLKPWVENFEDGKLTSKFTAAEFTPQRDGSYLLDHPISIFYLDKGQILKVTGENGVVNCDSPSPASDSKNFFSSPTSAPKNGSLHRVRVELLPSETSTTPTQWMETDNIHFDNQTLPTMYTETFVDAQGNTVPADQVPVTVRGEEYEFDGNGLTVVWDAQKRLQKLLINHGKRLEIIDPSKLSLPGMTSTEPTKLSRDTGVRPVIGASEFASSVSLASGATITGRGPVSRMDPPAVLVSDTHTVANSVDRPLPYRAVFHDQVQIDEAQRTMAIADLMTAEFLQKNTVAKPVATPVAAAPLNTTAPPAAPSATPPPPAPPATKPTKGPITIYWTGPLLVTPLKGEPMLPLAAGQSAVRLTGSPVKLTPEGSEVTAASVIYRNPDGAVRLTPSAEFPVVHLKQAKGLTLSTTSIAYDPATGIATLVGPSALQVPVNKSNMNVTWWQQGLLHIVRLPGQPNGVDRVDLIGDVDVKHPQFTLNSRELVLDLDLLPKAHGSATDAEEQLRTLTAIDDVSCRLIHPGKPMQGIDGDHLVIQTQRTADNKNVVPREVIADGHVDAFDAAQTITAGHLDALLIARAAPTTQGPSPTSSPISSHASPDDVGNSVDLESLSASTGVHAVMKNGATADADRLRVSTVDGEQRVYLWGEKGAILNDGKGSWLSGPIVHLLPATSSVTVEGPGSMETNHRSSTTTPANASPPKPIDVAWSKSMVMKGSANTVDVDGSVTVKNVDSIGTLSMMTGDLAHIDLVDTPKNQSTTTTQPEEMSGKQIKMLTLTGHVIGSSLLNDTAGNPLRQGNLLGDKLIYTAADNTAVVPGAGKLYVENHKPDEKGNGVKGEMAIQWSKQLTYNQNTQQITIDGSTRVGFEQEPKPGAKAPKAPMQMDSQRLIITLANNKTASAKSGMESGSGKSQGKMQLSHMQAIGRVHFVATALELYCDKVDYDPKTSIITATGGPRQPGRALNSNQTISGTFDELRYNTADEILVSSQNMKGTVTR